MFSPFCKAVLRALVSLRFFIITPAVTTVLGTWNIYWHFSKSLEMSIWESSSPPPTSFLAATIISNDMLEAQTFRSPEQDPLFIPCSSTCILLFLMKFFPSQTQGLIKFGASNNSMIHQVKLLPKGKAPQKWGLYGGQGQLSNWWFICEQLTSISKLRFCLKTKQLEEKKLNIASDAL